MGKEEEGETYPAKEQRAMMVDMPPRMHMLMTRRVLSWTFLSVRHPD